MASDWQIDGSTVSITVDETLTPTGVTLVWRSADSEAEAHLRPLEDHAGKVTRQVDADGSFVAVDTANGSNTYSLSPHPSRSVVHTGGSFLVSKYEERNLDREASAVEVEVDFVRGGSRSETASDLTQSAAASQWLFSFTTGTVATKRVESDLGSGPRKDGVGGNRIRAIFTASQSRALAEGPNRPDAVQVREFHDGPNDAVDNSPSRNLVSVSSPSGATSILAGGQYIVADWELEYLNDDHYRADMTLWSAS
jgi:hypothetical protein